MDSRDDDVHSDQFSEVEESSPFLTEKQSRLQRSTHYKKNLCILLLVLTNICTLLVLTGAIPTRIDKLQVKHSPAGVTNGLNQDKEDFTSTEFAWWARYGSHNHTVDDYFWRAINPAHGFVAIDKDIAQAEGLTRAMSLPSDDTKAVYLLEAYHQVHCLKILRQTFYEAIEGKEFTYKPGFHHNHCFSALLQNVICNADDTKLEVLGDDTAGVFTQRQCRDWDAVRNYAASNTACYRDQQYPEQPLRDQFIKCTVTDDGILHPFEAVDY